MTHYSDAELVTLAEGVHAFIGEGGDSNAGAFLKPEGWIVLDAQQHVSLAKKFRAALEATGERSLMPCASGRSGDFCREGRFRGENGSPPRDPGSPP